MAINKNVLAEKQATVLSEDGNTMYATIQMRHGNEADMDKSKFVTAEMGVATDTKKMVVAFAPNDTKEVAFKDDLDGLINKNQGTENSGKVLVVGKDGNVTPGETPIEIDSTLTQSGQAADAKATGDKLSSLSEDIAEYNKELFDTQNLADGYWNNQGTLIDSTTTKHTPFIEVSKYSQLRYWGYTNITPSVFCAFFDENNNLYSTFKHLVGDNIIDVPASAKYVSFSVRFDDFLIHIVPHQYKTNFNNEYAGYTTLYPHILNGDYGKESDKYFNTGIMMLNKDDIIHLESNGQYRYYIKKWLNSLDDNGSPNFSSPLYTGTEDYTIEETSMYVVAIRLKNGTSVTEYDRKQFDFIVYRKGENCEIDKNGVFRFLIHPLNGISLTDSTSFITNVFPVFVKGGTTIHSLNKSVVFKVYKYTSTGAFIECINPSAYENEVYIEEDSYVRMSIRFVNHATIDVHMKNYIIDTIMFEPYDAESIDKYGDLTSYVEVEEVTENLSTWTATSVYALYDNLMGRYPNIVTKKTLGYSEDASGGIDTSLPIYEYIISGNLANYTYNEGYNNSTGLPVVKPSKVLFSSGIHGKVEVGAVYGLYNLIKSCVERKNGLRDILANATIHCVPCANPYALNNGTSYTATGTNINRNLGFGWYAQPDQGNAMVGSEPYSANESKVYRDWLTSNSDAKLHIDFHTTQLPYVASNLKQYMFMSSPNKYMLDVYCGVVRCCADHFERFGTRLSTQNVHFVTSNSIATATNEAFYIAGIRNTCTLEFNKLDLDNKDVEYGGNVLKIGTEEYINVVRALVNKFC